MRDRLHRADAPVLLPIVVVIGFVLRVWGLPWGLTDATVSTRAHPDEWAVYWLFQWFGRTGTLNPCPNATWSCFFDWGAAFPYVAFAAHGVVQPLFGLIPAKTFGTHADMNFVIAVLSGRCVSALASTATILVAYRLAAAAYSRGAGILAALLVSLSGLSIQLAHFATPDSLTGLLMSLTLWAAFEAYRRPHWRTFGVAGACIGIAAGCEYHMWLLLFPVGCAWYLTETRNARFLSVAILTSVAAFLLINPYVLVDLPAFSTAVRHSIRMRTVDSNIQYGDQWSRYGPAITYVVRFALGYGVGVALTAWMIVGAAVAGWRRRSADIILASWLLPYFIVVTASPAKYMRYSAPLIVPLAILGGRAMASALGSSGRKGRLAIGTAGLVAVLYSGIYDAAYAGLFSTAEPRLAAARWASVHLSPGADVAYEALPNGVLNLPYFLAEDGFHPCLTVRAPSTLLGTPYVVLDDYSREVGTQGFPDRLSRFRTAVAKGGNYSLVEAVHYSPTFLGMRFPIDHSPHDWRYPAHRIRLYQLRPGMRPKVNSCFKNLNAALAKLYVPPPLRLTEQRPGRQIRRSVSAFLPSETVKGGHARRGG